MQESDQYVPPINNVGVNTKFLSSQVDIDVSPMAAQREHLSEPTSYDDAPLAFAREGIHNRQIKTRTKGKKSQSFSQYPTKSAKISANRRAAEARRLAKAGLTASGSVDSQPVAGQAHQFEGVFSNKQFLAPPGKSAHQAVSQMRSGKVLGLPRPVVIDGPDVAHEHGGSRVCSCRGIWLAAQYWRKQGHKVFVVIPKGDASAISTHQITDYHLILELDALGEIVYSPTRKIPSSSADCKWTTIKPYDDRLILQIAHMIGGVVVSNVNYSDIIQQHPEWTETVSNRQLVVLRLDFSFANVEGLGLRKNGFGFAKLEGKLLMHTWVGNEIRFWVDSAGASGPCWDDVVRFPFGVSPPPLTAQINVPSSLPIGIPGLRPIVIDGLNVALTHGNSRVCSCRGIWLAAQYWRNNGHKVHVVIPSVGSNAISSRPVTEYHFIEQLDSMVEIVYSPARQVQSTSGDNKCTTTKSSDDILIVELAHNNGGVIVSNDNHRDIIRQRPEWTETIVNRLLLYTWVGDIIIFPFNPMGANGPCLDEFVRFPHGLISPPLPTLPPQPLMPSDIPLPPSQQQQCSTGSGFGVGDHFYRQEDNFFDAAADHRIRGPVATFHQSRGSFGSPAQSFVAGGGAWGEQLTPHDYLGPNQWTSGGSIGVFSTRGGYHSQGNSLGHYGVGAQQFAPQQQQFPAMGMVGQQEFYNSQYGRGIAQEFVGGNTGGFVPLPPCPVGFRGGRGPWPYQQRRFGHQGPALQRHRGNSSGQADFPLNVGPSRFGGPVAPPQVSDNVSSGCGLGTIWRGFHHEQAGLQ